MFDRKGYMKPSQADPREQIIICFWVITYISKECFRELRAAMDLARLWHKKDRIDGAHQLLAEIFDCFTEGFETPDLIAARELLEVFTR